MFEPKSDLYYRYLSPSGDMDINLFYGTNRGFTKGHVFDDFDLLVEFDVIDESQHRYIKYNKSYMGNLNADNTHIRAVYFRRSKDALFHVPADIAKTVKRLSQQLPNVPFYKVCLDEDGKYWIDA